MKTGFEDKVVIITGSSMGIGKATASLLCSRGAKVVLNARHIERVKVTENLLKEQGYDVISVPGDISREEDCRRLIDATLDHYGKIDILINNAGVSMRGSVASLTAKVLHEIYAINTVGPVMLSIMALPHIQRSKGSIVFISSLAAFRGLPQLSVYCSSKMALTAITESLRAEHAHDAIHIGIVHIGITEIEEGKTTLGPDGAPIILKKRGGWFTLSKEKVAQSIVNHIEFRRKRSIPGFLGNFYFFISRYFPNTVEWLIKFFHKRMKKIYK